MSLQPLAFTGVSSMSDSLQQVLNRAVSIAKIPLQQLQAQDADVLQKKSLLAGLGSSAAALGSAVAKLGTIAANGAVGATSSDPKKVSVQNTGSTKPVVYTITDIESLARAASAKSGPYLDSGKTPVSADGKFTLEVGGKTYLLSPAKNTLVGLRDAINSSGAGVSASIFTVGSDSNYLSITASGTGKLTSLRLTGDQPSFTSVNLGSAGSAATATTAHVSDPDAAVSETGLMELVVGSETHSIDISGANTLAGLRDAVEAIDGVSAAIESDASGSWLKVTADSPAKLSAFKLTDSTAGELFKSVKVGADPVAAGGQTAAFADAAASAVSKTGNMRLAVGGATYDLTLANNSLDGLKAEIDKIAGEAGITASIVASGTGFALSVTRNTTGEVTAFSLADRSADVLSGVDLGSNVRFKLNDIQIDQKSNTVNSVVPGITFTILGTTVSETDKVTLDLSSDRSQVTAAIGDLVKAYNSMQALVGQQVGPGAGLLAGDGAVRDIQGNMRALGGYRADGLIKSLSEMGIEFDQSGAMSFDESTFNGLSDEHFQSALSFFGSSTAGFGALAKKFTTLTDPISGTIRLEQDGFDRMDRSLQSQITTLEDRINEMQIATARRLQMADALMGQLESQKTVLDASIQSANLVLYGRNDK